MKEEESPENGIVKWMVVDLQTYMDNEKVLKLSGRKDIYCTGLRITRVPWFHTVEG